MPTIAELEAKLETLSSQIREAELKLTKAERRAEQMETRAIQAEAKADNSVLESHIRAAVIDAGLPVGAVPDILRRAQLDGWKVDSTGQPIQERDGKTVTTTDRAPIAPATWIENDLRRSAYWYFGANAGNPAQGRTANEPNPWSRQHWNITDQGKYILREGMTKAEAMSKAEGVSVYATGPAKPKPTIVAAPVPAK